jgi:hypothetical protein
MRYVRVRRLGTILIIALASLIVLGLSYAAGAYEATGQANEALTEACESQEALSKALDTEAEAIVRAAQLELRSAEQSQTIRELQDAVEAIAADNTGLVEQLEAR